MVYQSAQTRDPNKELRGSLEKVLKGLGFELLDLNVFHSRKGRNPDGSARSVSIKLSVYKQSGLVSIEDCSKAHRAVLPRLELAFQNEEGPEDKRPDLFVEVASPGINRLIKEGIEFAHFTGREILCYRTDISDWCGGKLISSDEEGIVLKNENETIRIDYEKIGKAKLGRF